MTTDLFLLDDSGTTWNLKFKKRFLRGEQHATEFHFVALSTTTIKTAGNHKTLGEKNYFLENEIATLCFLIFLNPPASI